MTGVSGEPEPGESSESAKPRKQRKAEGRDARPIVWMVAFLAVALVVYMVMLGGRGIDLISTGTATGIGLGEYGALFDTVSVCFRKGLGAPIGSVLVGSADAMARARVLRKRLGGGWRQAGMLAAACLYALDHHIERLAEDHAAAHAFAAPLIAAFPRQTPPQKYLRDDALGAGFSPADFPTWSPLWKSLGR